jgi:uncharacterized membrane protein
MGAHELADLLIRWIHVIAGIMWIGNSMLFNWLDRNLERPPEKAKDPLFEGDIWLLHSGGFYEVEKKQLPPGKLPDPLHWFKWQNGFTWMSGICLLIVVYYLSAGAFLVDPAVSMISPRDAMILSVSLLAGGWLVYDLMWRFAPKIVAGVVSLALLGGIVFELPRILSGRAAYIHVGVLLGTLMTGNVWFRILPSQRALVAETKSGQAQDKRLAIRAKQRSIHNNYMTFPLLFIMISNHFPGAYSSPHPGAVLAVLMAAGAGVRHIMNIRFHWRRWWVPAMVGVSLAGLTGAIVLSARPASVPIVFTGPTVSFVELNAVITQRCRPCHSATPTEKMFPVAPAGVMFDTPDQIERLAPRIRERAAVQKTMPFINKTGITDDERQLIGRWIDQGAKL